MARGRSRARTTPRRVESLILQNAAHLREHPEAAAPTCTGTCPPRCPYRKARAEAARVHAARDDEGALVKLSNGGGILKKVGKAAQAYATLLIIGHEGEIPYSANTGTPVGRIPLVPRGGASSEAHAGFQHYHDLRARILPWLSDLPKGATLYATDAGVVCAHDGSPPAAVLDASIAELPVKRVSPNLARCKHVPDDWTATAYLEVDWKVAGMRVRVCEACATDNTARRLMGRAATRDPAAGASVRIQLPRLTDPSGGDVPDAQPSLTDADMRGYLEGSILDAQLFDRARRSRVRQLESAHEVFVVVGDEAYRPMDGRLLDALDVPSEWRAGIQAALRGVDTTVVLSKAKAAELVYALWADHGKTMLDAVGGSGSADDLYEPDVGKDKVAGVMNRAVKHGRRRSVDEALPTYARIPKPADLVDGAVRARLAHGDKHAIQLLEREARSGRRGAIAHVLLQKLGRGGHEFALTHMDREFAVHVEPVLQRLLEVSPEEYEDALVELLVVCGVSERPERA